MGHGSDLERLPCILGSGAAPGTFPQRRRVRPGTHDDFIQLLPDRSASITFDPIETTKLQVAITGQTYTGPGAVTVSAILQTQPAGGGDLAWMPIAVTTLVPSNLGGTTTLWSSEITLPDARGTRPFRLLIEEFETFPTHFDGGPQQSRLVYADVLSI